MLIRITEFSGLRPRPARHRRRGIAVVLVLGLLAITLAISYATLRGQGTTSQLARNNSRALDARVASQSGLAAAMRKISENAWAGVDTPISSNVTNHSWYQVSFTTGDVKLAKNDVEYPFSLTIDSFGYAADPTNAAVRAEHHSRCVVRLVRKRLVAEPAMWTTLTGSTVYQCGTGRDAYVQFPVRINGSATLLGRLVFCGEYPGNAAARDQYLSDLNARRPTLGDDRPFPDNLKIRGIATVQDPTTMSLITTKLLITPVEPVVVAGLPNHPGTVQAYKLYPGGMEYRVPELQGSYGNPLQNITVAPDSLNSNFDPDNPNPLGVYRSSGGLTIQSNVQITGTIITDSASGSEIQISGTNVALRPFNMPGLYGSGVVYQLPTAISADKLRVNSGSDIQIVGTALVWDRFEIRTGTSSSKFALTGNLAANELRLEGRTPWVQTATQWGTDKTNFSLNLLLSVLDPNRVPYFPDYQQKHKGFVVKPALTFSPDSSAVPPKPHWHDWSQPVYQADPSDPGLRWEVVRWEDNLLGSEW